MRRSCLCLCPLLLLCSLVASCAKVQGGGTYVEEDLARIEELPGTADLGTADLRGPPDPASPPDLAEPADLRIITGCQVSPQGGCPVGMKCTTHDSATTQCDAAGPAQRGQACRVASGVDSCTVGAVCTNEGAGQCRAFCRGDVDCVDPRSFCDKVLDAPMVFRLCSQPCDPVFPGSGCAAGLSCIAYEAEHTDCRAGVRGEHERCDEGANICKGGLACVNSQCRRICRKGDATVCAVGEQCIQLGSGTYIWQRYGACCPVVLGIPNC